MSAPAQQTGSLKGATASSTADQATRHVLPIVGCPTQAQFVALITSSAEDGELIEATESSDATSSSSSPSPAPSVTTLSHEQLISTMLAWIKQLFFLHDRALAASSLFQLVRSALLRFADSFESDSGDWVDKAQAAIKLYPFTLIDRVESELAELQRICGTPTPDASWTVQNPGTDEAGIATYHRSEPGGGTHSFLVCGKVNAPMFNCIALVKEADLFTRWLPAINKSVLVPLDNSRYRMQLTVGITAVWPLQNREAVLYGYGDVLERGVGVYFRSQSENEVFPGSAPDGSDVHPPAPEPETVRVAVRNGGFYFEKLDDSTTRVCALFNVDPKLPILPYAFLNLVSSRFCGTLLEIMRQKAPSVFRVREQPTIYQQRLEQNTRVYQEITRRLKEADENLAKAKQ